MYKYKSGSIFHGMGPFLKGIKVDASYETFNPRVGLVIKGMTYYPVFLYGLSGAVRRIPINQAV